MLNSKWNDQWYKAWGLEKPKEDTLEEVAQIEQRYIDAARAELEAQAVPAVDTTAKLPKSLRSLVDGQKDLPLSKEEFVAMYGSPTNFVEVDKKQISIPRLPARKDGIGRWTVLRHIHQSSEGND